jgi:hypothetical protein
MVRCIERQIPSDVFTNDIRRVSNQELSEGTLTWNPTKVFYGGLYLPHDDLVTFHIFMMYEY